MRRVADLLERVVAGVGNVVDGARAEQLQALRDVFRRSRNLHVADDTRGVAGATLRVFDFDGENRARGRARSIAKVGSDWLQLLVINRGAVAGDAVVVHRIHAVGREVHVVRGARTFTLDAFDGDAGESQVVGELPVVGRDVNEFAQPCGKDFHAGMSLQIAELPNCRSAEFKTEKASKRNSAIPQFRSSAIMRTAPRTS